MFFGFFTQSLVILIFFIEKFNIQLTFGIKLNFHSCRFLSNFGQFLLSQLFLFPSFLDSFISLELFDLLLLPVFRITISFYIQTVIHWFFDECSFYFFNFIILLFYRQIGTNSVCVAKSKPRLMSIHLSSVFCTHILAACWICLSSFVLDFLHCFQCNSFHQGGLLLLRNNFGQCRLILFGVLRKHQFLKWLGRAAIRVRGADRLRNLYCWDCLIGCGIRIYFNSIILWFLLTDQNLWQNFLLFFWAGWNFNLHDFLIWNFVNGSLFWTSWYFWIFHEIVQIFLILKHFGLFFAYTLFFLLWIGRSLIQFQNGLSCHFLTFVTLWLGGRLYKTEIHFLLVFLSIFF